VRWMLTGLGAILLLSGIASRGIANDHAPVTARIVLQNVATAGLRHHDAKEVWAELRVGDSISLVREQNNAHDPDAVRVDWKGRVMGYLPRDANRFIARLLDRGNDIRAHISLIDKYRNHRRKLEIEIFSAVAVKR
jgi:HIRAN domain